LATAIRLRSLVVPTIQYTVVAFVSTAPGCVACVSHERLDVDDPDAFWPRVRRQWPAARFDIRVAAGQGVAPAAGCGRSGACCRVTYGWWARRRMAASMARDRGRAARPGQVAAGPYS
jgi:hypothetical protein